MDKLEEIWVEMKEWQKLLVIASATFLGLSSIGLLALVILYYFGTD